MFTEGFRWHWCPIVFYLKIQPRRLETVVGHIGLHPYDSWLEEYMQAHATTPHFQKRSPWLIVWRQQPHFGLVYNFLSQIFVSSSLPYLSTHILLEMSSLSCNPISAMEHQDFFGFDYGLFDDNFPITSNSLRYDDLFHFEPLDLEQDDLGWGLPDPSLSMEISLGPNHQVGFQDAFHNFENTTVPLSSEGTLTQDDQGGENSRPHHPYQEVAEPKVPVPAKRNKNKKRKTCLDLVIPDLHEKIEMENSFKVFSSTSGTEIQQRKRKCFSQSKKDHVAFLRRIGACVQCKLHKVPVSPSPIFSVRANLFLTTRSWFGQCSFGMPCDHCFKRAGDIALGEQICSRRNLVATRFDQFDLLSIRKSQQRMHHLNDLAVVGRRDLYLTYDRSSLGEGFQPANAYIKLPIVSFDEPNYVGDELVSFWSYWGVTNQLIPDPPIAIVADSLPTTQKFVEAYDASFGMRLGSGPFKHLQKSIQVFVDLYCARNKKLPLVSLHEVV